MKMSLWLGTYTCRVSTCPREYRTYLFFTVAPNRFAALNIFRRHESLQLGFTCEFVPEPLPHAEDYPDAEPGAIAATLLRYGYKFVEPCPAVHMLAIPDRVAALVRADTPVNAT